MTESEELWYKSEIRCLNDFIDKQDEKIARMERQRSDSFRFLSEGGRRFRIMNGEPAPSYVATTLSLLRWPDHVLTYTPHAPFDTETEANGS